MSTEALERDDRKDEQRDRSLGLFAAAAIIGWVLVEVSFRWGLVSVLADPLGSVRGADMVAIAISFPLVAGGIALFGRRFGITRSAWEYTVSLRSVAAGLVGVVGYYVIVSAVVVLATLLGVGLLSNGTTAIGSVEHPLWVLVALLLVNGILVPIMEELAWRGVIQTALMESYGTIVGSVLTAAAFVLKHAIVDMGEPLGRWVSLIVLALLFCGLRARFGTASSTITHLGVNSISTALLISSSL